MSTISIAAVAWIVALLGLAPASSHSQALDKPAIVGRVSDATLAAARGRFDAGPGLLVSFGIERATYVNGQLVASSRFSLSDLSRVTPEQASRLNMALAPVITQLGAGNTFDTAGAAAGTNVVQNTLDGQAIRSVTTINAVSNSLQSLRQVNALSTLRDALAAPLAGR